MSAQPKPYFTPERYLAIERDSAIKHEYHRGEMYAMSGASREHNLISGNIFASLHSQFATRKCEVYAGDMRVKISTTGSYVYPDVVATCDKPRFEDAVLDTLLNPQVVIEVVSRSTETYDRSKKFEHYRRIDSLREYLLVSQDYSHIDRFYRGADGLWVLNDVSGPEGVVELTTIECQLKLSDVYAKIEFPSEELINRAAGLFREDESR